MITIIENHFRRACITVACALAYSSCCVAESTRTIIADRLPPVLESCEKLTSKTLEPGILAMIHEPADTCWKTTASTHVMFYLLPNGNTAEQTFGRAEGEGLDWHYAIQHVGAQTRRLRQLAPNINLVTIYLEAEGKSWPAWRGKYKADGDRRIRTVIEELSHPYGATAILHLVSHSGGGSFMFGFLNDGDHIPPRVQTLAFMDSNYAFDAGQHSAKLLNWLQENDRARLLVLAYDDRNIVLNGKPIVSATGGTFRSTSRMSAAFETSVSLQAKQDRDFVTTQALEGRLDLRAHTNPDLRILHTVLVEKNGVIQAMRGIGHGKNDEDFYAEQPYRKWVR